jgi:hypothetical protein
MIKAESKWYIQDANGRIYMMPKDSDTYQVVCEFNKGAIMDVAMSPHHNYAITLGENGVLKTWDYVGKNVAYQVVYSGKGTCLEHMPFSDGNMGRVAAAGFDNGIVRIISVTCDGIQLLTAFKAHDDAIVKCKYTQDLKLFVTASVTGDIFFFEIDGLNDVQKYSPICTLKLPNDAGINDMKWLPGDDAVIVGCTNGYVYEIKRPDPAEFEAGDSYLWESPPIKEWHIMIMEFQMQKNQKKDEAEEEKKRRMRLRGELPPEEDEPEEVWEPQSIRTIMPIHCQLRGPVQWLHLRLLHGLSKTTQGNHHHARHPRYLHGVVRQI